MTVLDFLYYAFAVVVSVQVICYLFIYGRFAFAKPKKGNTQNIQPVSVIVYAKNEAEMLKSFLPTILSQNYPNYEVVLINDVSYDNTFEIMEDFAEKHSNIKLVNVKNNEAFWGNKKYALTLGIKAATNQNLLFIEASSKPITSNWIKELNSQISGSKTIVIGYGAYTKVKNSILNKLIRFENLVKAIQYMSFAKSGIPFTGVGTNLAYTKKQFFDANGFMSHMNIKKVDHALFINQTATKKNTSVVFSKDSFTTTQAKNTFKDWVLQNRQDTFISKHYKFIHKTLLSLIYCSSLLFWVLGTLLISLSFNWQIVSAIIAVKLVVQYIVYGTSAKKLNELDLLFFVPFFEIFLILFQFVIFITNTSSKPKHWK